MAFYWDALRKIQINSNPIMAENIIVRCPECETENTVPKGQPVAFFCKKCRSELSFDDKVRYAKVEHSKERKAISSALVYLLAVAVSFPIVVIFHKFIPLDNAFSNIGKIIFFIIITAILGVVFRKFQNLILISVGCLLLFLSVGTFFNKYGFSDLLFDYRSMMNSLSRSPKIAEISLTGFLPFDNSTEIYEAVDYNSPIVRNFAHYAIDRSGFDSKKYYKYRKFVHSFAVFKDVNHRWNYVDDPLKEDYFAKASQTISVGGPYGTFKGDCDDYSIVMAAGIKAIGGKVRLIRTTGHLYPELYVGSRQDLEDLDYIMSNDLFKDAIDRKDIFFHVDENDDVWLNLDYTAKYPGGRFMNPNIIGILNL